MSLPPTSSLPEADLPADESLLLAALEAEKSRRLTENRLAYYKPYPKQAEFHAAGAKYRERLLMAGNQTGKTLASAMELAFHVTGLYPSWWEGHRFDRAIRAWACGETSEVVRETTQLLLLGPSGQHGTGCIPKASLVDVVPARGLADLADTIRVRHESGDISTIALKAYSQGRERFQGATIDYLALDEEPPFDVFSEALTRTNVTQGPCVLTFTPLKGVCSVVKRFIHEPSPERNVTTMTLDDALTIRADEKTKIIAQYPEHERATRTRGIPAMGSGRVFLVDEEKLLVEPMSSCPRHWVKLGGCDFGWDHPAAFVEMWWDRDLDIIYLVRTLRLRHKTPLQHVEAVRHWRLRWAWPHDGRNQTLAGAGVALDAPISGRWAGHDARARDLRRWRQCRSRLACRRCTTACAADAGRCFEGRTTNGSKNTRCITARMVCWSRRATTRSRASRYALMMLRFGQSAAGQCVVQS